MNEFYVDEFCYQKPTIINVYTISLAYKSEVLIFCEKSVFFRFQSPKSAIKNLWFPAYPIYTLELLNGCLITRRHEKKGHAGILNFNTREIVYLSVSSKQLIIYFTLVKIQQSRT